MNPDICKNPAIRIRARLCESLYLEPMQVDKSQVELKVEIYADANGEFTSVVLAKEVFLLEAAFLTGIDEGEERRGLVPLFVEDAFYDTSGIRATNIESAVKATLEMIREQLLKAGKPIEYLADLQRSDIT